MKKWKIWNEITKKDKIIIGIYLATGVVALFVGILKFGLHVF